MSFLKRAADNRNNESLAARARRQRFALFLEMLRQLPRPVNIIDVGGTQAFWDAMGFAAEPGVTVLLFNTSVVPVTRPGFAAMAGDAADMAEFRRNQFDAVFSNSVIEHVGDRGRQKRMADEVRRIGRRYFVQTPNYWFPIEPHFLFVGFQWLPMAVRVWLARHFALGWQGKVPDPELARREVASIRLLTRRDMQDLFPGAQLHEEKLFGLTKSFVAYGGW